MRHGGRGRGADSVGAVYIVFRLHVYTQTDKEVSWQSHMRRVGI